MTAMAHHPDHDAVAAEVRSWFRTSLPEIGFVVEERWFGVLSELGADEVRVILDVAAPEDVAPALADLAFREPASATTLWVDDPARDVLLRGALEAAGYRTTTATTHLALVGAIAAEAGPDGLVLEQVGPDRLEEWASVKLRCFGDTEDEPRAEQLAAEVRLRSGEASMAAHHLALLDGEPVGVLAYYEGQDQLVFNLGTRVPFRHRAIAQSVLARWAAACEAAACRSAIINAHVGGRPEALYRRIGFVDEVYWYQTYQRVRDR